MLFRLFIITNFLTVLPIFTQAQPVRLIFTDPALQYSPKWSFSRTKTISSSSPADSTITAERRQGGALYHACLDCKEEAGMIDIRDSLTDNIEQPVVLFSFLDLDPTRTHSIAVRNLPDDEFERRSPINFDSVIVRSDDGIGTGESGADASSTDRGVTPTAILRDVFSLPPNGITLTVIQTSSLTPSPALSSPSVPTSQTVGSTTPTPSGSATQNTNPPTAGVASNSLTTKSSIQKTTTLASPPTSATVTSPLTSAATAAATTTASGPSSNSNGSNTANSGSKSQPISSSLIAVISVLSILAGLSLIVGIFLFARERKRRQSLLRLPDLPQDNPRPPLREVGRSAGEFSLPPPRPRNPFENVSAATVPLDDLNLDYSTNAMGLVMNRTTTTAPVVS